MHSNYNIYILEHVNNSRNKLVDVIILKLGLSIDIGRDRLICPIDRSCCANDGSINRAYIDISHCAIE